MPDSQSERPPNRLPAGSVKVGAAAELLGTTVRTLRYYEEEGLLTPDRSGRGTRVYTQPQLARGAALLALASAGVTIDEMRRLAFTRSENETGAEASKAVGQLLDRVESEVVGRLDRLAGLKDDIGRARELISGCSACPNRPDRTHCSDCPVDFGVGTSDVARVVWDPEAP